MNEGKHLYFTGYSYQGDGVCDGYFYSATGGKVCKAMLDEDIAYEIFNYD